MTAKLRSFRFTAWTHRRGHYDDDEIPRGAFVEPDTWQEFRGAVLFPADPSWWDDQESVPDWSHGAFLADGVTGRPIPGFNFEGRPPEFLIEGWKEGRVLFGVLIYSARSGG